MTQKHATLLPKGRLGAFNTRFNKRHSNAYIWQNGKQAMRLQEMFTQIGKRPRAAAKDP